MNRFSNYVARVAVSWTFRFCFIAFLFSFLHLQGFSQYVNPQYYSQVPTNRPNSSGSSAFRQEIARFEINVIRQGKNSLPISQVPRVQAGDVIKVKMLDEVVGGIKPDQSLYNWTFLVAFVNPNRNKTDESSVSQEIVFRKTGWYQEYSFKVPFDSQPLFFLYPKPNYRDKIVKLLTKNYEEVQKLGEKTIEIAGAYAQIGMFLNELQGVLSNSYYGYNNPYRTNNQYPSYNNYNQNTYPYNNYGYNNYPTNTQTGFNYNLLMAQSVERLARSFNIQLPNNCWQNNNYSPYNNNNYNNYNNYGNYNNGYNNYGNYNNGYNNNNYGNYNGGYYGNNSNNFGYGVSQDLIGRVQCIAKNVRIEDFDLSISRLLQQGGILAAAQLAQKYPQLAYWINIAAVAIDFILKITKKTPLRIVPTVTQANGVNLNNFNSYNNYNNPNPSYNNYQNQSPPIYDNNGGFGNNIGNAPNNYQQQNQVSPVNPIVNTPKPIQNNPNSGKISVYAEAQPDDNQFITAYPIVIQKWQPNADLDVIGLRPPVLAEPCLHAGLNILKNTDITDDQLSDEFTREYSLQMSSENGFKKEFPLKKNFGLGGWELNITPDDIKNFPKIQMSMEAVIKGKRGFNEISSPAFKIPVSIGGKWEFVKESQDGFAVGARRKVTLRNPLGNCQCLQSVIYRPSFGGEFVYETEKLENNFQYSVDSKEVTFDIDTTNFQSGDGQFELKTFGGESSLINLKLYPQLPQITEFKVAKGDDQVTLVGEDLRQIKSIKINGRLANAVTSGNQFTPNPKSNSTAKVLESRTFVFENDAQKITEDSVSLELGLDDDRYLKLKKTYPVQPARPTILTNDHKEILGIVYDRKLEIGLKLQKNQRRTAPQIDLSKYPIFPITTNEIHLIGQNTLTDYDFKVENLSIETRIEKSQGENRFGKDVALPAVSFEVLDWANLKINFQIDEKLQKLLGGRRIQFRLRDSERGDSDWFTIKQTFVRIPKIESVNCNLEQDDQCELKGEGIEYISQVSVDGGQNWFSKLTISPTADGKTMALIPYLAAKKFLQIRLRDFPKTEGIPIVNYVFSSSSLLRKNAVQSNVADAKTTPLVGNPNPPMIPKRAEPQPKPTPNNPLKSTKPIPNQTDFLDQMEINQPVKTPTPKKP